MEELPYPLVVEILSRLSDSSDLARCRVVSKTLNAASYDVRSLTLICCMSRYVNSRSPETKHLVTPFKTVFKHLVRHCRNLESISLDYSPGDISFEDFKHMSDDLHFVDFNFMNEWLPSISHTLKSLSVSDFEKVQRRSEALSLISSTCGGLVQLVIRNAWLSVDGLCLMSTLTNLTLKFVRLDDEDLNKINTCFPNLMHLNLIGVNGLKEPKINLSHLKTCQWSVPNEPLSLAIVAPSLVDFHLKIGCVRPRLIFLEAPSLSTFNFSFKNTGELVLKNCGNIQCLQLEVEWFHVECIFSMFKSCVAVKRLTLDLVRRTQRVELEAKWGGFGLDDLLGYVPNASYVSLGSRAWRLMENYFRKKGLKDGVGMKNLKELVARIEVLEIEFTLAYISAVLDKFTELSNVSLLIHRDIDSCVAGNLISVCRNNFPRVRWRWGIWKLGVKDTWVSDST